MACSSLIGKICDQQRPLNPSSCCLEVVKHLLQGDRYRRSVAHNRLSEGVTDKDHVDARLVDESGGRIVVGSQTGDLQASQLPVEDERYSDFAHGPGILVHGFPPLDPISNILLIAASGQPIA